MNAEAVIESYVRDVAACLPRDRRNDVAFELRALLADELAARAEAEGRAPDRAMALKVLQGFGRPGEAARRYHERPAIIEASDTHHFMLWSIAGVVAIGVLKALDRDGEIESELVLTWLGLLVIVFGVRGWLRRRDPASLGWKPTRGPDWMPRWQATIALVSTLIFPVAMYADPVRFAETAFLGYIPTSGLALTEAFAGSWQRAVTFGMLAGQALLYGAVLIQGGWRSWSHWTSAALNLLLGLAFVAHAAPMAGPDGTPFQVFEVQRANAVAGPIFTLVGAMMILGGLYATWVAWSAPRPAMKGAR